MIDQMLNYYDDMDVIVIGSSPDVEFPPNYSLSSIVIGVNGGLRIAVDWGIKVNTFFTTSYLFRPDPTPSEVETLNNIQGLEVPNVLIDHTSLNQLTMHRIDNLFTSTCIKVHPGQRLDTILKAIGYISGFSCTRVSTGVWAICCALVGGARTVTITGINPSSNGHYKSNIESPRDHVEEDKKVMELLLKKYGNRINP